MSMTKKRPDKLKRKYTFFFFLIFDLTYRFNEIFDLMQIIQESQKRAEKGSQVYRSKETYRAEAGRSASWCERSI